jgi:hyperosmotically inducible periplasmic protein
MNAQKLCRIGVFAMLTAIAGAAAAQDRPATTVVKDAWITTQIEAKYFGDANIKGRNIDVDTANGVVTLTGEVTTAAERQRAIARAKEVDGVTRVVDRLKVVPAARSAADRAEDKAGKAADKADRAKDKADDRAEKVANKSQARADRAGNDISDAWITTKVQSKYYVDTDVRGLNIDVTTNGGVVTLTGKVATEAERNKALALAKSTDGVKQVIDKLTIGR